MFIDSYLKDTMINSKRKHRTSWRGFSLKYFVKSLYLVFFWICSGLFSKLYGKVVFQKSHRTASTLRSKFLSKSFGGVFWKAEAAIGRSFWNCFYEKSWKGMRKIALLEAFLARFRSDCTFFKYIIKFFRLAVFQNILVEREFGKAKV